MQTDVKGSGLVQISILPPRNVTWGLAGCQDSRLYAKTWNWYV